MAPAAGGAVGGAAAGALASDMYHKKQMEQRELAQQQELDQQAQQYPVQQSYAPPSSVDRETSYQQPGQQLPVVGAVGTAPAIPERDPDHVAAIVDSTSISTEKASIPAPIVATRTIDQSQAYHNPVVPPSASTTDSFLDDSEVGAAPTSGKTINGGPVPVSLVEAADSIVHPGVNRVNTDMSVSDLHVPGEYPKVKGTEPTVLEHS